MKQSDMIWMCLPQGLEELFEIVRFERTDQAYYIWLDEKKLRSEEDRRNINIVARGYTDYVTIQDYPLRGRPVFLHMRKNKWWDKSIPAVTYSNGEQRQLKPQPYVSTIRDW